SPRFVAAAARGITPRGDLQLAELNPIRRGRAQRFAHAGLLDEAADERAFVAVDARFDARIVADGHEAGLHRAERTVTELAHEEITIVDVHAHHAAGLADHPVGD